jgi:hypothetical protein
LGTITIDINEISSWSYTTSWLENYGKVRSEHVDFERGETVENEVGNGIAYAIMVLELFLKPINRSASAFACF